MKLMLLMFATACTPRDATLPDSNSIVDVAPPKLDVDAAFSRPLILDLGQSNAVGQGYVSEVDTAWSEPFEPVTQSTTFAYSFDLPLVWDGYDGPLRPRRGTRFGAELSLGRAMPDHDIAECAIGATSLAVHWDPDGDWPSSEENLYQHCMTFAHGIETAHGSKVTTILWFQGERDASDLASATAYGDNLHVLADRLLVEFPCARFVYYLLPRAETYADEVRAGQTAVSTENWMTMINVDALPRLGRHFTSNGYLQLGDLVASTIKPLPERCQ